MWFIVTMSAVCCAPLIAGLNSAMSTFRYIRGDLHIKTDRTYIDQVNARTGLDCAYLCSRHDVDTCSIARYMPWNGTCSMFYFKDVHFVMVANDSVDINTPTLYVSPGRKHIYLTAIVDVYERPVDLFRFTFDEAKENCEFIGGTLGTSTDVASSSDAGWDICACGWTVGGAAYTKVSVPTVDCPSTNLFFCNRAGKLCGTHCLFY